ncbi:MAG: hypothetical protein VKJ46_08955 [Leptolyngbyaceae bacterium]|nr:hypothetical protein [Leptolyngbyaceae bacterium]
MALRFALRTISNGLSQCLRHWRLMQNRSGGRSLSLDELERELSQGYGDRQLAV